MKKSAISILTVIFFMSVFIMGCSSKVTSGETEDPWEPYKVTVGEARRKNLGRYYLVKQNKDVYLFMDKIYPPASSTAGGYLVHNDIPAFVCEDGDSLVYFYGLGNKQADKIKLAKVNPPTGALHIAYYYLYDKSGNTIKCFENPNDVKEKSMITDKDGNEIGDVDNNMYNLNIGETYTVRVEEETGIFEEELTADWLYYSCNDDNHEYTIHPDLSRKGFASYDLSSLEPGYYVVKEFVYNIIEIR